MRHRGPGEQEQDSFLDMHALGAEKHAALPTAPQLTAKCDKAGHMEKRRERCLGLCPLWPCATPIFRRRFVVLKGAYIFKFADEQGTRPKGTPLPVEALVVEQLEPDLISIRTLRKEWVMRVAAPEVPGWLSAIRLAKQRAIRESMGHAPIDMDDAGSNAVGSRLFDQSLKREAAEADGMQMQMMGRELGAGF